MKKHILFIINMLCLVFVANSQSVSEFEAINISKNFIQTSILATEKLSIKTVVAEKQNDNMLYYVINLQPKGFILISGDKSLEPVLAFSFESDYEINPNPAAKMLFDSYKNQIINNRENKVVSDEKTLKKWKQLETADFVKANSPSVKPLIQTKWNQGLYYNAKCPANGKVPTGCVATALAQIINYFRYPSSGTGSYGYEHSEYGYLESNFSAHTYNYDQMPVSLTDFNDDLAQLMFDIGVSVDMQYKVGGSGMYNHKGAYTLKTHFGYPVETQYVWKDTMPQDYIYGGGHDPHLNNWDSVVIDHLNRKIPIYYAGWDKPFTSGHAFIIDGYSDSTQFHINFGWGGNSDAYFALSYIKPTGYNFTLGNEMIINAVPPTYVNNCAVNKVLTSIEGVIDDGSGPIYNYQNNANCSWLIAPKDSLLYIELEFLKFNLDSNDFVTIYDGADENASILTTYYGGDSTLTLKSTGNKVFVQFISDSDSVNDGWLLSYKSVVPDYCSENITYTAASDTIEDGSKNQPYKKAANCTWLIKPENAKNILITFLEFDLNEGDKLTIYKGTASFLCELSGNTLPAPIFIDAPNSRLTFESGINQNRGQGFKLYYDINVSGTNDLSTTEISIFPNPAKDFITIKKSDINTVKINFYDINGKLIKSISQKDEEESLYIGDISDGTYEIKFIENNNIIKTTKIVVVK